MKLNQGIIDDCLEHSYRQDWMSEDDWQTYLAFLMERGLNLKKAYDEACRYDNITQSKIESIIASHF